LRTEEGYSEDVRKYGNPAPKNWMNSMGGVTPHEFDHLLNILPKNDRLLKAPEARERVDPKNHIKNNGFLQ